MPEYTWDHVKRLANLEKHGLDFNAAWRVYEDPNKVTIGDPYPNEERFRAIAEIDGTVRLLVYTMRGNTIRIISFRAARRRERSFYYAEIQNR